MDPVFENNVILTETERLTMNSQPKAPKYARNKNVIVIGGSGSGKTRFYVKPNLMPVSYTHLDVYKRQMLVLPIRQKLRILRLTRLQRKLVLLKRRAKQN